MGKESNCRCEYSGTKYQVKAILESGELILRGELKKRIPRPSISDISVRNGCLFFEVNGEQVSLALGETDALKWQSILKARPPSLAHKLGITATSYVRIYGGIDDGNLHDALETAGGISDKSYDLFLARVNDFDDLDNVIKIVAKSPHQPAPLWVIYPKGSGQLLSEATIRSTLRTRDLIDNKVASVSPRLTALRFVGRKQSS